MLAHFPPDAPFGQRNRNGDLVHVQADIRDTLLHEAGTGQPGATLETCIL